MPQRFKAAGFRANPAAFFLRRPVASEIAPFGNFGLEPVETDPSAMLVYHGLPAHEMPVRLGHLRFAPKSENISGGI